MNSDITYRLTTEKIGPGRYTYWVEFPGGKDERPLLKEYIDLITNSEETSRKILKEKKNLTKITIDVKIE